MERFFFYFISVFKGVNSCVVLKIGFILIFIVYITNLMMMKVVGCVCVCSCGCAAVHQPYEVTYSGIKNFGLEYRRGETVRKKQQGCSSTTRPAGLPEKKRVFDVF